MTTIDLKKPQLNFIDSSNFQNLVVDGSKLVVSTDAEFNSISISGLDSDRTTALDRTQKITSDGSSTFITGPLVCDSDINVQGEVFNVNAETKISDHFLVQSDGGSTSAVKIENTNNTSPPLVVDHAGSTIFSLATDGTLTNATTTSLQSQITQEVSDRTSAVSSEATTRASADTTLQSNIDSEASTRASADTTLQSNIDSEASARASAITAVNSSIATEQSERLSADTALSDRVTVLENDTTDADAISALDTRLTTEEGNVDTLQAKTQHQSGDASSTKFAVGSKVHWDTGDQYFCIKSRDTLSVSGSSSSDKVLDFKSHQYAINGANTGVYEICLMSSDASSSTAFFNAKLVRYTDSAVMYPIASYKVSASYTHATDTISFTFDESTTQDFTVSWQLIN